MIAYIKNLWQLLKENQARFNKIRRLAVLVSFVLLLLIISVEVGRGIKMFKGAETRPPKLSTAGLCDGEPPLINADACSDISGFLDGDQTALADFKQGSVPGSAIRSLSLIDAVLLITVGLIALQFFVSPNLVGKAQGVVILIVSILLITGSITWFVIVLAELFLMIALLLSIPFGTLIYLALYGTFAKGSAAAVLGSLFPLKLLAGLCLPIAQESVLKDIRLILLFATMLLAHIIVTFLHNIVPGILVSITDAIATLIVIVLAVIWQINLLVRALKSVKNLL